MEQGLEHELQKKLSMEEKITQQGMEKITERLSESDNLYFPRAHLQDASTPPHRKSLLLDLLSRDPAVFLERYGPRLTLEELNEFDVLKEDYEINWHLKRLRSLISPTSEQQRSRSLTVKNRRRAYMDKLISEGNYFSEDAMREREPYLHHEYLGKFQDPYGRRMARPGERWSETLMRRAEETILLTKIRGEQQRLGVHESEWVGIERPSNMEEEEEEEEEEEMEEMETETETDDEDAVEVGEEGREVEHQHRQQQQEKDSDLQESGKDTVSVMPDGVPSSSQVESSQSEETSGVPSTSSGHVERPTLSPVEMQEQLDQFIYIMQQKFLTGQDREHFNYSTIDEDETLDDHWLKEANYDAEEKYFAED